MTDSQAEKTTPSILGSGLELDIPDANGFTKYARQANAIDYATVLGVLGGFAMVISAMVMGNSASSFIDVPSMLIVLGGTFLITTSSFGFRDILEAQGVTLGAVVHHAESPARAARQCLYLSDMARRNGVLSLQTHREDVRHNRFLYRGLTILDDGYKADQLERVLQQQAQSEYFHKKKAASILRRSGEVSPAMGLIGTLVGLVQMLGNLEDPSAIGPGMAIALLTTFYGTVLANMVFNPIATKLERLADTQLLVNQVYSTALESISRQENPRRLETLLNTLLPAKERVGYFD